MGLFANTAPPRLPEAPTMYTASYVDKLLSALALYFARQDAVQQLNIANLNIDLKTLPTQTALATLRAGDIYRDTTAGNTLKIKV